MREFKIAQGDRSFCHVCGKFVERFLEHRGRPNARCPIGGSLERHRFSMMVIGQEFGSNPRFRRVLHIAPERAVGRYLRSHTRTSYVTMDLSAPKVTVNYDIAQTPFRNNEFDLIYCSHVLEHVPHDRAAMQELFRILAPGGVLIVMVPIGIGPTDEDPEKGATPELRLRHFGQSDHVRRYGLDIVDRLHQASFETRVAATSSSAYAPYIRNCGFLREDFVFSAEKKSEKTRRGGL